MRKRLVAALLGLTLVVLLVHDIPLTTYLRTVETDRIITALERDSFIIAGKAEESLEDAKPVYLASLNKTLQNYKSKSGARVIVTDAKGIIISTSNADDAVGESYLSRPEIARALTGEVASGRRYSQTLNDELLFVSVPVLNGNTVLGVVRVTFSSSVVDNAVNQRIRGISTVAGITLLLAGLVAFLLATSVTRRLQELRNVTEQLASGDLDVRAEANEGAPEIKSLAESFNTMADQLNSLIAQQRAFAGDASHQLRTPLTALQLRLERTAELIFEDPEAANERLEAAMAETERLQRLVEGLLVLSRSEAKGQADTQTYDLAIIARERAESWSALADERNISVVANLPKSVWVHAVPGAIEQIIDNYVDNAIEIVPEGTTITIEITTSATMATIHVKDEGRGMSPEDLAKAFNRFWRGRSDAHGSGLGLAIVNRLATASGGRAFLENRIPHGLDAQADLPLA